jgi:two-component system, LytTR family, sensor kinase
VSPAAAAPPPDTWRPFIVAWVVFWLLMVTVAVQNEAARGSLVLWQPLLWEGSSCLVTTLMLVAGWRTLKRLDQRLHQPRRWFAALVLPLPLLATGFVAVIYALRHAVYALLGQTYTHLPWGPLFVQEALRFSIFYGLFVVALFGLRSFAQLAAARLRAEQALALQRQAQLLQLTQQIEPHFLFNALNTIAATVHDDAARAELLILRLAKLLRAATDLAQRPLVPLHDELALLEAYAAIMLERFGPRVTLGWQVAPAARECPLPTLALQPLLENAFHHGVEQVAGPVRLTVQADAIGGRLRLRIVNHAGMLAAGASDGVGLGNLRARLAAAYGDAASLTLAALPEGGVEATLELPCEC